MTLFLIDLAVLVVFFIIAGFVLQSQGGFSFDPFASFRVLVFGFPIWIVIINAIVVPILYGFSLKYFFVFLPLVIPVIFYFYDDIGNYFRAKYWRKYLKPIKEKIESIIQNEGYEIEYIHGLHGKKSRFGGRLTIKLNRMHDEEFDTKPEREERLIELINQSYPRHDIILFAATNDEYRQSKKNQQS